jgi:2,4-dienoyl-CoA reductase-like NADH-dependent reductase (Old Yellow Enzyme family)
MAAAPHLFAPLALRGVTARNRITISPMQQFMAADGFPSEWHRVHLGQFALGGAGIVFTEAMAVSPRGRISYADIGLWSAEQAQALRPLTEFMRDMGALPAAQISHAGRRGATTAPWDGKRPLLADDAARGQPPWELWAPSAIASRADAQVPRELDVKRIERVREEYARTAALAHDAGFDALELHGGHGYMLHSFLSPLSNRRGDRYGGSRENRMRFVLEVVERVRQVWPEEKPLFFRLSAFDGAPGGWEVDDSIVLVRELRHHGVDVIDVSSGGLGGTSSNAAPHTRVPGYHVPIAARIRDATGAITQVVGLITDAAHADTIVRSGSADLIAIAREALRDPFWAAHASEALGGAEFSAWPEQYAWWLRARAEHVGNASR